MKKIIKKKKRIQKRKKSRKKLLLIPLLIIAALLAYFLLYAFNSTSDTSRIAGNACISSPLQPKVLQIEYYPEDAKLSTYLDAAETGFDNKKIADQEAYVGNISNELLASLNQATKYKGYKNPSAPQFLNFTITATKKYYTKIPRGYLLDSNRGVYRPNYNEILKQNDICDYVDNKGVTEVWMFGYHYGAIEPDESRMSSKYGDISNSGPKEHNLPAQFRMPTCSKPYVLYNYNYDRTALEMLHNRIHQLENILAFADGTYPPTLANTARGKGNFWGNFSEYVQSNTQHNYKSSCGNSHFTPNWSSASDEYKYDLQTIKENNCEDWNPDPSKSVYKIGNCSQWGCTQKGYYMWYLQNMPGFNNGIEFNGQQVRNWWEALYNPVEFLDNGRSLVGESTYPSCSAIRPVNQAIARVTITKAPTIKATAISKVTPTVTRKPTNAVTPIKSPIPSMKILPPTPCALKNAGDVNFDGYITDTDIYLVQDFIAGRKTPSALQKTRADLNNSKTISSADLTLFNSYWMRKISTFPVCVSTATPTPTKRVSTPTPTNRVVTPTKACPIYGSNYSTYCSGKTLREKYSGGNCTMFDNLVTTCVNACVYVNSVNARCN